MQTWVYKGNKKPGTYLYIASKDTFDQVPDSLIDLLGELSLVLSVDLSDGKKLAQVDAAVVLKQLNESGYFLQLPPGDHSSEKPC